MNFIEFKNKYQKVEVSEYPNTVTKQPLVSICIQTYQHASYIRECLDSILAQKVDFPIEILLGEDGSTDGTREICIEYAKKFPNIIRLFLHERENNIKINGSPSGRFNFRYNLYCARGTFIAFCEGDDSWIGENKLKKQILFLESNPDFSLSFHGAKYVYHDKNKGVIDYTLYGKDKVLSTNEVIVGGGGLMPTASMVFKAEYSKELPEWSNKSLVGDYPIAIHLATKGKVGYINEVMSVYNINIKGSWTNSLNIKRIFRNYKSVVNMLFRLTKAFKGKYLLSVIARTLIETKYLVEYVLKTMIKKAIRR